MLSADLASKHNNAAEPGLPDKQFDQVFLLPSCNITFDWPIKR